MIRVPRHSIFHSAFLRGMSRFEHLDMLPLARRAGASRRSKHESVVEVGHLARNPGPAHLADIGLVTDFEPTSVRKGGVLWRMRVCPPNRAHDRRPRMLPLPCQYQPRGAPTPGIAIDCNFGRLSLWRRSTSDAYFDCVDLPCRFRATAPWCLEIRPSKQHLQFRTHQKTCCQ